MDIRHPRSMKIYSTGVDTAWKATKNKNTIWSYLRHPSTLSHKPSHTKIFQRGRDSSTNLKNRKLNIYNNIITLYIYVTVHLFSANINACASMCFHKNQLEKYYLQRNSKNIKKQSIHQPSKVPEVFGASDLCLIAPSSFAGFGASGPEMDFFGFKWS